MAQCNPEEKVTVAQVLKLVDKLSSDEQEQIRKKLSTRSWGQRFQDLCNKVEATRLAQNLPRLTEEEIIAEVKAERANKSCN